MESLLLDDFVGDDEELELLRRLREDPWPDRLRLFLLDSFRFFLAACCFSFFIDLKNSSSLAGPGSSTAAPCAFDSRRAVLMVWSRPCRAARRSRTESISGSRRARASCA